MDDIPATTAPIYYTSVVVYIASQHGIEQFHCSQLSLERPSQVRLCNSVGLPTSILLMFPLPLGPSSIQESSTETSEDG